MNQIFPNQMTLKINKRLKNESDKQKLISFKKDLFDLSKKPIDTFTKYGFEIIEDIKNVITTTNICLFNFRFDQVNNHIAKNVNKQKRIL